MSLVVENSGGGSFTPVASGMHLARLYRIIDLGTQKSEFDGKINYLHKVKFVWEVHGEDESGKPMVTDKGEPMVITKDYTLSWGEKANLRKDLESWRGRPFTEEEQRRFDLKNILDQWCMINVQHKPRQKGGVFANIVGVTPVPKIVIQWMGMLDIDPNSKSANEDFAEKIGVSRTTVWRWRAEKLKPKLSVLSHTHKVIFELQQGLRQQERNA
jgi:hypothetical protein